SLFLEAVWRREPPRHAGTFRADAASAVRPRLAGERPRVGKLHGAASGAESRRPVDAGAGRAAGRGSAPAESEDWAVGRRPAKPGATTRQGGGQGLPAGRATLRPGDRRRRAGVDRPGHATVRSRAGQSGAAARHEPKYAAPKAEGVQRGGVDRRDAMTLSPTRKRGTRASSLACASGSKVVAVVE